MGRILLLGVVSVNEKVSTRIRLLHCANELLVIVGASADAGFADPA